MRLRLCKQRRTNVQISKMCKQNTRYNSVSFEDTKCCNYNGKENIIVAMPTNFV